MSFALLDKRAIEEREDRLLAPYAMRSSESRGRVYEELEPEFRTTFQRDRDRIIHSTAFRRLEYKTQVFVNHEGDHYRTRLTHTLEVAQVSRSIARVLGLHEDLVEALALSHDLGHPPFGHAGEEALDALMFQWGGFDHNLQSLMIVDRLEKRYPEFDGLNLSWEIRESILKHGTPRHGSPRAEALREFGPASQPLLEAQLTDVADSLAYTNHDIDDGLRSEFISLDDLKDVRIWRQIEARVSRKRAPMSRKTLVARTISALIDVQVKDLITATHQRLEESSIDSVEKVRSAPGLLVDFSPEMVELKQEMVAFLDEKLYRHYRTLKMTEKAKRFINAIFNEYMCNPGQLSPAFARRVKDAGKARAICDYIAGMTDRFCQDEYKRLFHPFERM